MDDGDDTEGRAGPLARLRRVDDAVVPVLQQGARSLRRRVGRPFRAIAAWEDRSWFRPVAHNRGALAFAAVLVATAASAVHFDRYPDLRAAEAQARQGAIGPGTGGEDDPAVTEDRVDIGPPVGVVVDDYIERRHDTLLGLDATEEPAVAVVSFDTYLTSEQVLGVLGPDAAVASAHYRVPAEGEPPLETEVVGGDLSAAVEGAVEDAIEPLREEETEVERLLESGTVEDEEYQADYERRLSELRSVRNVLETGAPVVFAVVVEAPVTLLQELVGEEHVRLVDVAPTDIDRDGSRFFGVRPEDTDRATYGREG